MGGLKSKIPITFWTMTAGVFAISGIPPLAGFVSKDEILSKAFFSPGLGPLLWFVGVFTAGLTAFYMFRLWYMTFFGERRDNRSSARADVSMSGAHLSHGIHDSGGMMLFPLAILAVLSYRRRMDRLARGPRRKQSVWSLPRSRPHPRHDNAVHEASSATELVLMGISIVAVAAGWFAAHVMYFANRSCPASWPNSSARVYSLVLNKYWIDELYNAVVVRPLNAFARIGLWWTVDKGLIDGSAYAAAGGAMGLGAIVRRLQSGNIRSYAGWLAGGAAAIILLMYFGFGMHWMAH